MLLKIFQIELKKKFQFIKISVTYFIFSLQKYWISDDTFQNRNEKSRINSINKSTHLKKLQISLYKTTYTKNIQPNHPSNAKPNKNSTYVRKPCIANINPTHTYTQPHKTCGPNYQLKISLQIILVHVQVLVSNACRNRPLKSAE